MVYDHTKMKFFEQMEASTELKETINTIFIKEQENVISVIRSIKTNVLHVNFVPFSKIMYPDFL